MGIIIRTTNKLPHGKIAEKKDQYSPKSYCIMGRLPDLEFALLDPSIVHPHLFPSHLDINS